MHSFAVNLSTRYDDYSDVGDTTNPKIALNWGIVEAVMLRANYAEAFVAPALTSRGANEFGLTGESGFSGVAGQGLPGGPPTVSTASFPSAIGIPGCPAGLDDVLVEQRHGTVPHGRQRHPAAADGQELELRRGHHSAGGRQDCASASRSWINELRGGITAPVPSLALGSADLSGLIQFYPTGATPAQIAALATGLAANGRAQCHDLLYPTTTSSATC